MSRWTNDRPLHRSWQSTAGAVPTTAPDSSAPTLSRRSWLTWTGSLALSACGGGGGTSSVFASLPGTGGTGAPVYAQGSIAGFGSVIINGVRFDDTLAQVQLNGQNLSSDDLRLGMVATIQARRDAAGLLAASRVEVWSLAQGQVTDVQGADLDVAGMAVRTDAGTSLDGLSTPADLRLGDWVQVWGMPLSATSDHWLATRLVRITAPADGLTVTTGLLKDSHGALEINDLRLDGVAVAGAMPTAEQVVRVHGVRQGDVLVMHGWQGVGTAIPTDAEGEIELEGYVTAVASATRFRLGAVDVDASSASFKPAAVAVTVNARVEVYGAWQGGVLKANVVEFEEDGHTSGAEISGRIERLVSPAQFVLRGQPCDASAASYSGGSAADLRNGARVKVVGQKAGATLRVSSVAFKDD